MRHINILKSALRHSLRALLCAAFLVPATACQSTKSKPAETLPPPVSMDMPAAPRLDALEQELSRGMESAKINARPSRQHPPHPLPNRLASPAAIAHVNWHDDAEAGHEVQSRPAPIVAAQQLQWREPTFGVVNDRAPAMVEPIAEGDEVVLQGPVFAPLPCPPGSPCAEGGALPRHYPTGLPGYTAAGETLPNPWRPPGIRSEPWPFDEYLCDGDDQDPQVKVDNQWNVHGLGVEDTIVHYDTRDGRLLVQPSNRACVYAPRFAAVRRVSSPLQQEIHERIAGMEQPLRLNRSDEIQIAATAIQPVQPQGQLGLKGPVIFREEVGFQVAWQAMELIELRKGFLPYANIQIVKTGQANQAEKLRLSQSIDSAIAWTDNQALQVAVEDTTLVEAKQTLEPNELKIYEIPGRTCLRVFKIASHADARPGETVEFIIRFDNLGDDRIGNVTIMDNLTTRLEYIPDTAECSLDADFFVGENEAGSSVLRWEIKEPIAPHEGGIIRFQCIVR